MKSCIERLNNYDEHTTSWITWFIGKFHEVFPGILTDDILVDRITKYLKNNIVIVDDPSQKGKYSFDPKIGVVKMWNTPRDKKVEEFMFHEFIHVVINQEAYDNLYRWIYEALTTMCQERYVEHETGIVPKDRLNSYITDFVKQLNVGLDYKLLEQAIRNPENIHEVLVFEEEEDFKRIGIKIDTVKKKTMNDFGEMLTDIQYAIRAREANEDFIGRIVEVEAFTLNQTIIKLKQSSSADIDVLEQLYEMSYFPDYQRFIDFIDELINQRKLPVNLLVDYPNLYNLYMISKKSNIELANGEFDSSMISNKEFPYIAMRLLNNREYISDDMPIVSKEETFINMEDYSRVADLIVTGEFDVMDGNRNSVELVRNRTDKFSAKLAYAGQDTDSALRVDHFTKLFLKPNDLLFFKNGNLELVYNELIYRPVDLECVVENLMQFCLVDAREVVGILKSLNINHPLLDEFSISDFGSDSDTLKMFYQDENNAVRELEISRDSKGKLTFDTRLCSAYNSIEIDIKKR